MSSSALLRLFFGYLIPLWQIVLQIAFTNRAFTAEACLAALWISLQSKSLRGSLNSPSYPWEGVIFITPHIHISFIPIHPCKIWKLFESLFHFLRHLKHSKQRKTCPWAVSCHCWPVFILQQLRKGEGTKPRLNTILGQQLLACVYHLSCNHWLLNSCYSRILFLGGKDSKIKAQ